MFKGKDNDILQEIKQQLHLTQHEAIKLEARIQLFLDETRSKMNNIDTKVGAINTRMDAIYSELCRQRELMIKSGV